MTITIGSLFSGIGGFDLAAERAGMDIRWSVEIDPTCRKVLAHHWPDVPQHHDVRTVGAHNLERVDVIAFGSPCQDLSIAGRRAGFDGERSGLYHEAIRIIRELRPELIVWENVADALNSRRGRDFGIALDELANSGALDIGWRVLDARWFGVAQRRRRVFVVADFGGRRTEAILALSESLSWHPAPGRQARQVVAATLNSSAPGERGYRNDADTDENLIVARALTAAASSGSGYRMDGETDTLVVANTVTASAGHHGRSSPRGDGSDNLVMAFYPTNRNPDEGIYEEVATTLKHEPGAVLAFFSKDSGADATLDLAPTMRAMNYDQSWLNGGGQLAVAVPNDDELPVKFSPTAVVRRLMPIECARLQGFPDDWIPSTIADSHHYRMLGNAVCVPVVAWLLRRVRTALEGV